MSRKIGILIIIAMALRLLLVLLTVKDLRMNPDEEQNYEIAYNNQTGKGYTWFYPDKGKYILTAYHGSFPVYMYEFLIKNHIPKSAWVLVFTALFTILFGISIYYFYLIAKITLPDKFAYYATVIYSFYPSVLFYIGTLFFYENFVMPLSIIIIYRLMVSLQSGFSKSDYLLIPAGIVVSCLFRPHAIVIYFFVLIIFLLLPKHDNKKYYLLPLTTIVLFVLCHIPLMNKNKQLWGENVLSTQTGFELLQGHHPAAKGSWINKWRDSTNSFYQYAHQNIQGIDTMNELQESRARRQLALDWIRNNPMGELKLSMKKILIYFTPNNYPVHRTSGFMNPLTALVHLFFLTGLIMYVIPGKVSPPQWLILAPIIGSIVLSLIFFVGHRWRYYADPFMVLVAMQAAVWLFLPRETGSKK